MSINTYDRLMALRSVPDAYQKWKNYRNCLTQYIIRNTSAETRMVVIGAGECNDIDLQILADHFSMMELVDINPESTGKALARYSSAKPAAEKLTEKELDVIGVPANLYRNFCAAMEREIKDSVLNKNDISSVKIDGIFQKYMELSRQMIEKYDTFENYLKALKPDYIICSGLHSQLYNVFPQLAEIYSRYTEINTERIFAYAAKMNELIAGKVNSCMCRYAQKGIIFGLESGRLGLTGGVEGSWQAINDINKRIKDQGWESEETAAAWPFCLEQGKIYNMKLLSIKLD